ncbi:hypothetical protein M409DRAFT_23615 [Zasmidium cellare ATCC 36951]|uniref:Uncharacterized protein n=1 Tax=Zasmidium cellare ATCC 36951 TaxID=1080233 RepID=A0A6A6CF94_ZASCE|nr:uncharacterized protein M409DRAFT_23615 [Zasmidium cellare ATCC 36951]KAF2165884.1 hypothetical protein M409DRAFT_23615 [Zasmidium cellare ATCC 36951]
MAPEPAPAIPISGCKSPMRFNAGFYQYGRGFWASARDANTVISSPPLPPLGALIVPSLAVAIPQTDAATGLPQYYHWNITSWHAGCARSGCSYNFNVTGHKDGIYPSFLAYCAGEDIGFFEGCEILEGVSTSGTPFVAASLQPSRQDGVASLAVSLSFTDADTLITYNITGTHEATYNAFVAPLENFSIFVEDMTVTQVA